MSVERSQMRPTLRRKKSKPDAIPPTSVPVEVKKKQGQPCFFFDLCLIASEGHKRKGASRPALSVRPP